MTIQVNRGPESTLPTLAEGEPAWTTDTHKFVMGDGATNHEIGATGATGAGVPTGGTTGQALTKIDATNYNTQWSTVSGAGGMVQLAQITNGSTAAMTFSSIPGAYSALLLVLQARAASAAGVAYQLLRFNGDTAGNYQHVADGRSGGASFGYEGGGNSSIRVAYLSDSAATANYAGVAQVLIPNYAGTSFFKQILAQAEGTDVATATDYTVLSMGGQWLSTAAITSITFVNTMLAGSVCTLYGLV